MHFRASNPYDYYRPKPCARRVALRHRGVKESPRTEFDDLLARLGASHETAHLDSLSGVKKLEGLDPESQERETLAAIRAGVPAIYQARFRVSLDLDGESSDLVGLPDFLIRDGDGYIIRDSKLARSVEGRHPEIALQLQLYGWLYEQVVGKPPVGLQVHSGSGDLIDVPYDGGKAALEFLRKLRRMRLTPEDTYEPVGWSKCNGCGYFDLCWKGAEQADDIALLPAVSQDRAIELRGHGISTIQQVPAAIEDPALHGVFYQGKKKPRLRDFAVTLLRSAEAHVSGKHIVISPPELPAARNFVMLDLEGMPPYQDDLEKVYLWGMKVYGENPSGHLLAQAGFGAEGDREGWFAFLRLASSLLAEHGDLPFIHWGSYERTKLQMYIDRFGDPDGTAVRILDLLVDLLAVVRRSLVFPRPSLSLKVIEKYVGFERKLPESNGAWAMCRYIEATETSDAAGRKEIMSQILAYNEEDLDATWAVLDWVRRFGVLTSVP